MTGARTYQNLDIRVGRDGAGSYASRVVDSPAGEAGPAAFSLPFSDDRRALLELTVRAQSRTIQRHRADPATSAALELGGLLFEALFHGEIRDTFRASEAFGAAGLRIRLDLTEVPELASLPWELLYDRSARRFLALSERTPIVRYLSIRNATPALQVKSALNVVVLLSSPVGLDPLDADAEWNGLRTDLAGPLAEGLLTLTLLAPPTLEALHRHLRTGDTHVLHFVGHGEIDPGSQEGILFFEDRRQRPVKVWASQLGALLYDHDPLRLVVLNACHSGSGAGADSYGGMAQGLIQHRVPCVVAMQAPISDRAGICFARDLYSALAVGHPIDQAISGARKALMTEFDFEWVTPVLFLRSNTGQLFETSDIEQRTRDTDDITISSIKAAGASSGYSEEANTNRESGPGKRVLFSAGRSELIASTEAMRGLERDMRSRLRAFFTQSLDDLGSTPTAELSRFGVELRARLAAYFASIVDRLNDWGEHEWSDAPSDQALEMTTPELENFEKIYREKLTEYCVSCRSALDRLPDASEFPGTPEALRQSLQEWLSTCLRDLDAR